MKLQKPIYVETRVNREMEQLWTATQNPKEHERWDLRFTRIHYLDKEAATDPQRFTYETKIGFGMKIAGEGVSSGTVDQDTGKRTSGLQFSSDERKSLIKKGRGFWQYETESDGATKFLTRYDYSTRFGKLGKVFDHFMFRPLIGWATAWSFDALKLWLEREVPPEETVRKFFIHSIVCLTLALIFMYQGIVPKLLYPETGELEMIVRTGMFQGFELVIVQLIGAMQIAWGLLLFTPLKKRPLFLATAIIVILLGIGAAIYEPFVMIEPFNMVTLNLSVLGLCVIGFLNDQNLAKARNCIRKERG